MEMLKNWHSLAESKKIIKMYTSQKNINILNLDLKTIIPLITKEHSTTWRFRNYPSFVTPYLSKPNQKLRPHLNPSLNFHNYE